MSTQTQHCCISHKQFKKIFDKKKKDLKDARKSETKQTIRQQANKWNVKDTEDYSSYKNRRECIGRTQLTHNAEQNLRGKMFLMRTWDIGQTKTPQDKFFSPLESQ